MGRIAKYDWNAFTDPKTPTAVWCLTQPEDDTTGYRLRMRLRASFRHWRDSGAPADNRRQYVLHIQDNGPRAINAWIAKGTAPDPDLMNPGSAALTPQQVLEKRRVLCDQWNALHPFSNGITPSTCQAVEQDIGWQPGPSFGLVLTKMGRSRWEELI